MHHLVLIMLFSTMFLNVAMLSVHMDKHLGPKHAHNMLISNPVSRVYNRMHLTISDTPCVCKLFMRTRVLHPQHLVNIS